MRTWEALQKFKSGKIVVAIAGVPHKCPPSPNEATFMVDEFYRKKGLRDKVEISFVTPYPRPYPAETLSKVIEPLYEERGINLVTFFNAESVDPAAHKMYSLEGDSVDYDLLIAVPPHHGTDVIRNSGFGDEDGWIPADKGTMRVKGHDDAFAIGDATAIPISKSGVVAHLQSPVVAENILLGLGGSSESMQYNGREKLPHGGREAPGDVRLGDVHFARCRSEPLHGQVLHEEVFLPDVLENDEGEYGVAHGALLRQDQHSAGRAAGRGEAHGGPGPEPLRQG